MTTSSLPDLASDYPLSPEQLGTYRDAGSIRLDGVCAPDEIAIYREIILKATMENNRETRSIEERDTYGKAFLQVMNLWRVDEQVRKFTLARRFAKIAADLMGVESVRIYHDQALFKEPGGGHTPWHQDQFYWPLDTDRSITLWMPLVDIDSTMGSMTFADGSQKDGFIPIAAQISDQSEAYFESYVKDNLFPLSGGGAMRAGDATFHSGWTLHRAPGNVTGRVREVMTVIYYPADTKVSQPSNDFQRADLKTWLDSRVAGTPAAGPLNPVVYP